MKFVCDRCQTRYSIADEKVRQKILRIRCKTCGNVIVVQGERPGHSGGDAAMDGGALPSSAPRPASSGASWNAPSRPSSAPKPAAPGSPPLPPPAAAPGPDPLGRRVEWYLAIGGVRSGPFSRAEAARRTIATNPGKTVHVWKEGMPGWKHADEVSVIARELSMLRPPPPPPPHESLMAPPASPKVAAMPSAAAKSAKAAQAPSSASLFPGKPHPPSPESIAAALEIAVEMGSEAFADSATKNATNATNATKKAKNIPALSKEPDKGSFADITTEKGKNLRALEDDPLFASVPTLSKPDRPPLPAQPQPPVGAKVTPPAAASSPALPVLQTAPAVSASQPDLGGVSEVIRAVDPSDPPSSPELAFPVPIALSASETPFPEQ
ncbi:MAG TPA: zinc-ribbon domain-containing protein, partial [Polyangia bacterium]